MKLASIALALAILTVGDRALAEPPEEDDAEERATQLSELARKLYKAGEYEEAAKTFAESYAIGSKPSALFNQARALQEAGDVEGAATAFRRYLNEEPDGEATSEATIRLRGLERQIELEAMPSGTKETSKDVEEPTRGRTLRFIGGALILGGVGVVAAGAFSGLQARKISDEFKDRPSMKWTDAEIARFSEGERADQRAILSLSAGGVAIATGLALYVIGQRMGVEVTPTVSREGVGASASIRF